MPASHCTCRNDPGPLIRTRTSILSAAAAFLAGAILLAGTACAPASAPPSRDFVFFVCSDLHVGAEDLKAKPPVTAAASVARVRARLETLRGLVGQEYPVRTEPGVHVSGTIPRPHALLMLGDLIDGHKDPVRQAEQYRTFDRLFPVEGVRFEDATVPVIGLAGNHDGEPSGPQRRGLVSRNHALLEARQISVLSSNGVHFALNRDGVHLVGLGLCAADTTDAENPFKYGQPGPGSWNDPERAFSFLKKYLELTVGESGKPVILMQHYGFDSFSMNDWNWWTPKQRRALYRLLAGYNIAAILHGHNHHAEHYQWPDPMRHAADLQYYFDGEPPANYRRYDVLSCGDVCWVVRILGDRMAAFHYGPSGWTTAPEKNFIKDLR